MNDFMNDSTDRLSHNSGDSCQPFTEDISLLAAGCLDAEEERKLRFHLDNCTACRQRYEQIARVVGELRRAAPSVIDSRFSTWSPPEEQLDTSVSPHDTTSATWRRLAIRVAAVAACAALLIGGVSRVGHWHSTVQQPSSPEVASHAPGDEVDESAPLPMPTLLALRWAGVESDEAFDRLLARNTESILAESTRSRPFSTGDLP